MGLSVRIFRNFFDCFRTVRAEFRECVQIVQVEFLGLFSDSQEIIFGTVFEQSGTGFRFGFDPGTIVFKFCGVFWYHRNSVTNREETKRCSILYEFEIWAILCVVYCWKKINNMLLCVKIMLICVCVMY